MAKIILNADDFGRSLDRNRAIDDSFKQGLIRSAGLMLTTEYLQSALDYISNGDYVKNLHVHLNLSSTYRWDNESRDTPITEAMRKDPYFCKDGKFVQYNGSPRRIFKVGTIRKWKTAYEEIVAQYNKFIEITNGRGNTDHVDFHLWYNLSWPVAIALKVFTRKYHIKSVRYIGLHHKWYFGLFRIVSWNPHVKQYPAANIDYYLSKYSSFKKKDIIELYCHPNYKDGVLLDDSASYLKHERQPMQKQIQLLKELGNVEFVSWESLV